MRVLYDHQVFSLQDLGGVSRYYYELLRCLSCVPDVKAELFLGVSRSKYPFEELSSQVRISRLPGLVAADNVRFIVNEALSSCLIPLRGVFDVYHPTHYRIMPAVRARRVVAVIHDCTHEKFPATFRHAERLMRYKRALCARADAIICVSNATRQDLCHFYDIEAAKVRVIYQGLTRLPRGETSDRLWQNQLRRDYVLYVGGRSSYKNFGGLLQAFRNSQLHRSLDLVVVGGGELNPEEKAQVARLELGGSVISIPKISDVNLRDAYAKARLFAYPSLSEGFGLLPLEAMSLGCPVVASKCSAIPEVCGDAPFYFDPGDEQSFHRALLSAAQDEAERQLAIARGAVVADKYSWERNAQQTLEVYRDCQ